jgi:hypothetical protein
MRAVVPVVTLLLLALSALAPLALASPPDPLWIGGVFDGADGDDVIVAVTSTDGVTVDAMMSAGRAVWLVAGPVPPVMSFCSGSACAPVTQGRAPPSV